MNHGTNNALRALLLSSATAMPITFAAKDKEIAKVEDNSNVPDFMREDSRLGKENIGNDDRIIPRVQLAAAISTPVTEGKVEAGHFYHTVLEEDLGETLDIVIVHHSKRYTLWTPRHMGGGILARASDALNWDNGDQTFEGIQPDKARPRYKVEWRTGKQVGKDIGLGRWGSSDPANEDSAPAATLTHVLICVAPSRPELGAFAVLLQRTGEGVAKSLLTKSTSTAPLFLGRSIAWAARSTRRGRTSTTSTRSPNRAT